MYTANNSELKPVKHKTRAFIPSHTYVVISSKYSVD